MGVEMIKDKQGKEHLVFTDEDFYNDDIMGSNFQDYEILQVLPKQDKESSGFVSKVRSKINSKIYSMKKINYKLDSKDKDDDKKIAEKEFIMENEQAIKNDFEKLNKLSFPNIIKYYKYFMQDSCLYIIFENINFGDLEHFLNAYITLEKPIETNTLWNIFMQCILAVKYIHSQNIIHKNISLSNIFMTENKIVKLGDFKFSVLDTKKPKTRYQSPEMKQNLHYDRKTDIYALGVVFHELCYFAAPNEKYKMKNENIYPEKMKNIIESMLKDEKERPDANELYKKILEQYIRNVARLTSIDSVFRCMYSFKNFTQIIFQNVQTYSNEEITPVAYNYMNCIQRYFSKENEKENAINLNNFRNLFYNNTQMNNEIEIKPSLVIEYLLEKLNKETSSDFNGLSLRIQNSNFDDDKEKSYNAFYTYFKNKFTSHIAKYFIGFLKTKRICQTCKLGYYSFNLFPFIEFDLDICQGLEDKDNIKNLQQLFLKQHNIYYNLNEEHKIVCQKCKCIKEFKEFKRFNMLPENFIISLYRGESFKNKMSLEIPLELDLTEVVDNKINSKFNLVGIIKRCVDNKGIEYYISIYLDNYKKCWMIYEKGSLKEIEKPLEHNNGLIMLLFYSAKINIIGI